jgi:hypothetical protein
MRPGVGPAAAPRHRPGVVPRPSSGDARRRHACASAVLRDAFPHVVAMLDEAVRIGGTRSTSRTTC